MADLANDEWALTPAEYHALVEHRGRPLTDGALGTASSGKRATDAAASAAFEQPDDPTTGRRAVFDTSLCGTVPGYWRHRNSFAAPPACQPCKDAYSAHMRARQAALRDAG